MIVSAKFDTWHSTYKDLTAEQWGELRSVIPGLPAEQSQWMCDPVLIDDEGMRAIARLGLQIELVDDPKSSTMLVKLQDRLTALGIRCDELARACANGAAVQIALPDTGLMLIDEVDHLDNACTDELQRQLDLGWRILAVCPPNAQRRPDYILGRRRANGS